MIEERVKLLFGPYQPPPLQRGDRAFCLYRDRLVVVTGWSDAPISWPLCRGLDPPGGRGLLVDDELARAVRHESALAIRYWWGVGGCAVGRWRKVMEVGRMDSEGSRRLILDVIQAGIRSRGDEPPKARRRGRRRKPAGPSAEDSILWTQEEVALVGVLSDHEVARRTGRTLNAVRLKRKLLGRANPDYPHYRHLPWTAEQDQMVLSLSPAEVAARTGHTVGAVLTRKGKLLRNRGNGA